MLFVTVSSEDRALFAAAELPPQLVDDRCLRIEEVDSAPPDSEVVALKPERVQEPAPQEPSGQRSMPRALQAQDPTVQLFRVAHREPTHGFRMSHQFVVPQKET